MAIWPSTEQQLTSAYFQSQFAVSQPVLSQYKPQVDRADALHNNLTENHLNHQYSSDTIHLLFSSEIAYASPGT